MVLVACVAPSNAPPPSPSSSQPPSLLPLPVSTEAELGRALSASSAGPWMAYQAPCPGLLDASPTAAAKVTNQALVSSRAGDASAVLSLMAPEKSRGAGMLEKLEAMEQSVGEGKGMFPGLAGLMRQLELLSDIRLETLSHRLKEVTRELATRDLKRTGITFQEGMEETEAHQRVVKIEVGLNPPPHLLLSPSQLNPLPAPLAP